MALGNNPLKWRHKNFGTALSLTLTTGTGNPPEAPLDGALRGRPSPKGKRSRPAADPQGQKAASKGAVLKNVPSQSGHGRKRDAINCASSGAPPLRAETCGG